MSSSKPNKNDQESDKIKSKSNSSKSTKNKKDDESSRTASNKNLSPSEKYGTNLNANAQNLCHNKRKTVRLVSDQKTIRIIPNPNCTVADNKLTLMVKY